MTITVDLDYSNDFQVGDGEQQLTYNVRGTSDESEAYFSLVSQALPVYNGRFAYSATIRRIADDVFQATVGYKAATPEQRQNFGQDGGGSSLQFEIGTETLHITQSKSTVSKTTATARPAADHKGAIGVSSEGIEGCDVLVGNLTWSETHTYPLSAINQAYLASLSQVVATMNANSFRGFSRGEVLFLGATGGVSEQKPQWELTYRFAMSPNQTNIVVGDITVPSKLGWDYLWIEYLAQSDDSAKRVAQRPYAAYVERVYDFSDFGKLRLNN